jgi:hypothetical protein
VPPGSAKKILIAKVSCCQCQFHYTGKSIGQILFYRKVDYDVELKGSIKNNQGVIKVREPVKRQ